MTPFHIAECDICHDINHIQQYNKQPSKMEEIEYETVMVCNNCLDNILYCDDCGIELGIPDESGFLTTQFAVDRLPVDISNSNKDESVILCRQCFTMDGIIKWGKIL